jgi:hypothetical protein
MLAFTPDVEDGQDVGVLQRSRRPRLPLEAAQAFRVACEGPEQDFDGHVATEAGIARALHLVHPAGADLRHDHVRVELRAGGERHERPRNHGQRPSGSATFVVGPRVVGPRRPGVLGPTACARPPFDSVPRLE